MFFEFFFVCFCFYDFVRNIRPPPRVAKKKKFNMLLYYITILLSCRSRYETDFTRRRDGSRSPIRDVDGHAVYYYYYCGRLTRRTHPWRPADGRVHLYGTRAQITAWRARHGLAATRPCGACHRVFFLLFFLRTRAIRFRYFFIISPFVRVLRLRPPPRISFPSATRKKKFGFFSTPNRGNGRPK